MEAEVESVNKCLAAAKYLNDGLLEPEEAAK